MLKKYTFLFCFFIAMTASLSAQTSEGCDGNRYFLDVFDNTTKTTVKFAENRTGLGATQELFMDIYEPMGDNLDKRPLIIWAFGGAFITGERETMEQNCIDFAKKGYVAATIDYRLWNISLQGIPDSLDLLESAVQATADLRAAVRFFRQDADTDNLYNIDTDFIFAGGVSAGAIAALNVAHLDDGDAIPDYLQTILDRNGGLEGDTGDSTNLSYSSEVSAAINLSGGLHQLKWLDDSDPPFISFHGDDDGTVPYLTDNAVVLGLTFLTVSGSGDLKGRADAIGVDNYLYTVPGGGHENIYIDPAYAADRAEFYLNGHNFLHNVLCDNFVLDTESPELQTRLIGLSPNPASEQILLDVGEQAGAYDVQIFDQLGRMVQRFNNVRDRQLPLQSSRIGKGMFIVRVDFRDQPYAPVTRKILFH
ncbi:MAG: T9SS type A sorting domain-containing protein [Bacteroidota bacterium]